MHKIVSAYVKIFNFCYIKLNKNLYFIKINFNNNLIKLYFAFKLNNYKKKKNIIFM